MSSDFGLFFGITISGFALIFLLFAICVCCQKRNARIVTRTHSPVVVTSATHTAPGGYPVTQLPPPGYQPNAYVASYPAQTTGNVTVQMPMPMPVHMQGSSGMQTHGAPYGMPMPHPGAGAASMNPPPYDAAIASPSVLPTAYNAGYEKQAAYNPNYAAQ